MTSKCNKVKNPCKICLATVTRKTGLQCQGACQKWVHYSCLNYTPGKIKDIKTGVITVTCPCPDCKTEYPKEFRTNEPFSCTNIHCPANKPPQCENESCPSNQKMNQTSGYMAPLASCDKNACKKHKVFQPQCIQTVAPTSSSSSGNFPTPCAPPPCPSSDAGDTQNSMMPSLSVVEQMCNTVGQLTNQINDLMCKMKQVVKDKGALGGCCPKPKTKNCEQKGPKSQCPKPCFCAQNPRR